MTICCVLATHMRSICITTHCFTIVAIVLAMKRLRIQDGKSPDIYNLDGLSLNKNKNRTKINKDNTCEYLYIIKVLSKSAFHCE